MSAAKGNKRIAVNTLWLYGRKGLTMLIALYSSRVLLKYLGVDDFGLYGLVGSIVLIFNSLRTMFASSIQRFMNVQREGKYICWLGLRNDIRDLLESSNIMAFPSYYREGVPKSLIEASAIGRPIVTCDSVGCRDVVDNGVNGYLVQPRSPRELAEKLKTLIDSPELRKEMGKASRAKAEREFSIKDVIAKHLEMYDELTGCLA